VRAFLKGGGGGAAGAGGGGGGVVVVVMLVCLGAAAALGACRFQRVGEAVQQVPNELEPRICLVCVQVADCTWWWWCGLMVWWFNWGNRNYQSHKMSRPLFTGMPE